MAFRTGLITASRELCARLVEVYAQLDDAVETATRDELVATIRERVTAFITSSVAGQRGAHAAAAAREGARLVSSYGIGVANDFDLAVYERVKAQKAVAPASKPSSDDNAKQQDDPLTGGEEPTFPSFEPELIPQIEEGGRDSFHVAIGEGVDALLITAAEPERDAVLRRMTGTAGRSAILSAPVGDLVYYVGQLGACLVALTMSRTGATMRDGSTLAVNEAIGECSPRAVIAVGMCWGMMARQLRIGDVLVSTQIVPFDVARRQDEGDIYRGPKPESGGLLLSRFRNVIGWSFERPDGYHCQRKYGPVLSGESLFDGIKSKRQLHGEFPDAIGGEMEGTGIYGATAKNRGEWIIVKAVCDWGDGTKHKRHQDLASAVSASLVARVLSSRHALADLPHMEGLPQSRSKLNASSKDPAMEAAGGASEADHARQLQVLALQESVARTRVYGRMKADGEMTDGTLRARVEIRNVGPRAFAVHECRWSIQWNDLFDSALRRAVPPAPGSEDQSSLPKGYEPPHGVFAIRDGDYIRPDESVFFNFSWGPNDAVPHFRTVGLPLNEFAPTWAYYHFEVSCRGELGGEATLQCSIDDERDD